MGRGKYASGKKKKPNTDESAIDHMTTSDMDSDSELDSLRKKSIPNKKEINKIIVGDVPDNNDDLTSNNVAVNENVFLKHDKGPYFVTLEKEDINHLETGKFLFSMRFKDIAEIIKLSKNTVRIKCADIATANKILSSEIITSNGYKAFIPSVFANSIGVARDIPLSWTEEEIKEFGSSNSRILKVERLNFWDNEKQKSFPCKSIKITFRSYKLPAEIKIYNVLCKLSLFIPKPVLCKQCLRYGHTMKYCRNKKICQNCSSSDHTENCESEPKCNICRVEANHLTISTKCPEKKIQTEIKKVMVSEKVPFYEANRVVRKNVKDAKKKNESDQYAAKIVTLKSQVDFNENLLKDVSKVIDKFKNSSGTENEISTSFNQIQNMMYSFMIKNGLITLTNDASTLNSQDQSRTDNGSSNSTS